MGEPFRPWLSLGQMVAWRLQRAVPTRRFELDILAFLGDSLEQQHKKLIAITKRPDAVIIDSGHNEFTAHLEENRDYSLAEEAWAGTVPVGLSRRSAFSALPTGV